MNRPAIAWQTKGQEPLFDGNDYYRADQDIPWLDDSVMSDDQLNDWRTTQQWDNDTSWRAQSPSAATNH